MRKLPRAPFIASPSWSGRTASPAARATAARRAGALPNSARDVRHSTTPAAMPTGTDASVTASAKPPSASGPGATSARPSSPSRESRLRNLDSGTAMKLIIQIPCLNEEDVLPQTLADLPREVEGFDTVEWLVIDDGSTDRTTEVARECGVDHVVRFTQNKGLAVAFQAGIDAALKLGADVMVNTDADNQYRGEDIERLVTPILEHRADLVVGGRNVRDHEEWSGVKKALQSWGSWVVRRASETEVPDTT